MEGKDVVVSGVKELEPPDISVLMLSATLLPFPQLVEEAPSDQNALLIRIIENLEHSLPLIRSNVRRAATTAFLSQSSRSTVTGKTSDDVEDIDHEHIAAQNDEMISWLSMPASTDVKYAIAPGQAYKPVVKKRTASGTSKLSEGSLASISALRTTKSRMDDLVKQHDDHAKHVFKYYCDAYQRRMGKPWSSRRSEVHAADEPMQDVQSAKPKEPETHGLKRSSTLPSTLEAHPLPITRAATIAIEPSAAESSRASKPHLTSASTSVVDTAQKRQKTLDVLMELQRRARAEWVLATDSDRKEELYEDYLQAKDNRKRFKYSVGDASMEEEEEEETESNTAQDSTMSHLQRSYPRPADLPMKPQLQSQLEASSAHPISTAPSSASAIFKIPTQGEQRHLITSRRLSVDTTTSDESYTAPSKPTVDPRRRPNVSIGVPGTTLPVAPMMGSIGTVNSGTETPQLNPYLDKARDPRRRPQ